MGDEFPLVLDSGFSRSRCRVERPDKVPTRNFRVVCLGLLLTPPPAHLNFGRQQTDYEAFTRNTVERHDEWYSGKPPDHPSLNI
jgi:hypothetical protein